MVLGRFDQPFIYARALANLAEMAQPSENLFPRADGANKYHLYKRIGRILNQDHMKTNLREKIIAPLLLAGCCIIVLTISSFSSGFSIIRNHDPNDQVTPAVNSRPRIKAASTPSFHAVVIEPD